MKLRLTYRLGAALIVILGVAGIFSVPTVMASSATLIVRTSDDLGMPLRNVEIRLEKWGPDCLLELRLQVVTVTVTSSYGIAWFRQIPPGRYRIIASRNGFERKVSDPFDMATESITRCEIYLSPDLPSTDPVGDRSMEINQWPFPAVGSRIATSDFLGSTETLPERMRAIPGVLINPETGMPLFSSLRTSDIGLIIDGIPVIDPADHRPGFFPPAWFTSDVTAVRAGMDLGYCSSLGANIHLETPSPGSRLFTGIFGVSDILVSDSFLDTPESRDAFNYWNGRGSETTDSSASGQTLIDRRYQLLLRNYSDWAHMVLASEWRESNHGYVSDYVGSDSLSDWNTWFKATRQVHETATLSVTAGYQKTDFSPENQWRLRGLNPLLTEKNNVFSAVEFRKRFGSTYWYDILLSNLDLSNQADPLETDFSFKYPYGLGNWMADSRRRSTNLVFKGGRITRWHAIETGFHVNWMDITIFEGFEEETGSDSPISYIWKSKNHDYEFSMWGRDRWFLHKNIELGIGIRWDRFHYLELSDYLSPRFYAVLQRGNHRLTAGVERIVQSPGMGFNSEQTVIPMDPNKLVPVTEPQQGFRWYGNYRWTPRDGLSLTVGGHYSLLTRTVVMLPLETDPGIEFIMPVAGDAGRNMALTVATQWRPHRSITLACDYAFNRSRLPWGEDVQLSSVRPYLEMPWGRVFYRSDIEGTMPLTHDLTHAIHVRGIARIPWIDVDATIDYHWTTGRRFTRFEGDPEADWSYDPEAINDETGDDVNRIDIDFGRTFGLSERVVLECHAALRNALNDFQFAQCNPFTGNPVVDPYRTDFNQPRTITGSMFIRF
ncbi:TonB-dependent receptor [bacterium]|nr:TonB-dependent receptor [candidate division CSSED10-310 bacterium]